MTITESYQRLNDTVIANGYCVGCGACAVLDQSPFSILMDDYGMYQSRLSHCELIANPQIDYEKICPFGNNSLNEDEIAEKYFSYTCEHSMELGYYNGVFAGHVAEGDFRKQGSSGGMGSWVLNELLEKGLVDYVVHVKSASGDQDLNDLPFTYQISESPAENQRGGKSRYYPVELSEVLKTIRSQPGRYAVVGLPCFIKSIRLLQMQDPILAERIRYCVGLVCGHLKSARYAESLAWQMGVAPEELQGIDFRIKDPSQPANRYSTYVKSSAGEKIVRTNLLFGADWGAGAFKYKACDFCDDVFAETADIVLGDAWLPEYAQDSYGTNVVVTRSNDIRQMIVDARNEGRLELDDLGVARAIKSQDAGLRHRKIAIGYRLHCEVAGGYWVPTKRTSPARYINPRSEMKRQRYRCELRDVSHRAFKDARDTGDFSLYTHSMGPLYRRYLRHGRSFFRNQISSLKQKLKRFVDF